MNAQTTNGVTSDVPASLIRGMPTPVQTHSPSDLQPLAQGQEATTKVVTGSVESARWQKYGFFVQLIVAVVAIPGGFVGYQTLKTSLQSLAVSGSQHRENRRSDDLKEVQNTLEALVGNEVALQSDYLSDDPKTIANLGRFVAHYERLHTLVAKVEDMLSATAFRQMAVISAHVKGWPVGLKYLDKAEQKLASAYDPVDATYLYNARALILTLNKDATNWIDVENNFQRAIESAEKIEDLSLRRAGIVFVRHSWATSCYSVARFDEGDRQMKLACQVHKFSSSEDAVDNIRMLLRLAELKVRHGDGEGMQPTENMVILSTGKKKMPDGSFQWGARAITSSEHEREKKELAEKQERDRLRGKWGWKAMAQGL